MKRLAGLWVCSLWCRVRGHSVRSVVTGEMFDSDFGMWTAGYRFCGRCDVTLEVWGE